MASWLRIARSGVNDVAVVDNSAIPEVWLTSENGSVSCRPQGTFEFERDPNASGFRRIAAGPNKRIWAVGSNESLWTRRHDNGQWTKAGATGVVDVSVGSSGTVWVTDVDGNIWFSTDGGTRFHRDPATGFTRIAAQNHDVVWAVGSNGTLWFKRDGQWSATHAEGVGDVGVSPTGVWLCGLNGTVWSSSDAGRSFRQDPEAGGIESIDAGGVPWTVGRDGSLWQMKLSL